MIEHVFAVSDFPADVNGGRVQVWKGSHWPASDPIVKRHPERFSTDPRYGLQYTQQPQGYDDPPVEQVTNNPGERRNTRRSA